MAGLGTDLVKARNLLSEGSLVAIPTETVYGLAGNALNVDAVASIFATKKRPSFDPLILHTDSLGKVSGFVLEVPALAKKLADKFWPGPLTILFKKKSLIPDLVTSGLDTVAVRIPNHPLTLNLLKSIDFPLAAPSANPFGYVSPTTPQHVQQQLGESIPYILDGGDCEVGVESTIISFEHEQPTVLRMGGLAIESIEEVLGKVQVQAYSSSAPAAPGMLKSHYAPGKSFVLIDSAEAFTFPENDQFAVLVFDQLIPSVPEESQYMLAPGGDVREAAKGLFGMIRMLDAKEEVKEIIALKVPEKGLGRAVNDRLRRASATE
ncbi:MAG: threonylcarbamoyl-AMP synthase [Roseivirga sp.]|nr:threonylcarbamoyl-AMP synthase [Roseivirga sp.]